MAVLMGCGAIGAMAQGYPAKPITNICGQPVGSGPDIMSRMFAETMSTSLGQRVLVNNRTGSREEILKLAMSDYDRLGRAVRRLNIKAE
ncbi:MAG: hypothetical protein ACKVQK_13040 [Burkholderiales bacterium]